ncbi:AraC family transcriptional regulator [Bradyrhizobium sp. Ce-3]|uniref:AraC family transcriptional regulator n=1 Tax=Bradyrhizobium sp. Ce-3 TaxID=2913970 RepID=UPI001FC8C7A5|nr:AraC family transcriptional regulator [Bradyrhizobium sp. Ce-3]
MAVLDLYDFLRDQGIATDGQLLEAGLNRAVLIDGSSEALPPQEQRLPEEQLLALWRIAASNTEVPQIGLLAGQTYNPSTRGVLASLLCHCSNVGEALQVFQHHIALMNPSERWETSVSDDSLMLTISFAPDKDYPRPAIERSMGALVTWMAELTGISAAPTACTFAFPRPRYHWQYAAVFGKAVSFGGDVTCMRLPRVVLDRPIRTANSYLKTILQERAHQALQKIESESLLVNKVRQRIGASLDRGLGIDEVCRSLHLSRPTLYRRLKREGTSYRELLAAVRKELAYRQIRQGQPVACVSDNLGFKDVSTFHRAFRRWFKQSPGALRAQTRAMP